MDFITIDFETSTSHRDSPCEIGLTFVQEDKVIETRSWLIKPNSYPHFDSFNIFINGIKPQDVANSPEFNQLWETELKSLIDNKFLIAHNAGFDIGVLRKTLEAYKIPFPSIKYSCSYIFSKKTWTGLLSYDLKSLCHANNIEFSHHRAGADSLACAELSIKAFELTGIKTIDDFPGKLGISIGQLFNGGYIPSKIKQNNEYSNPALIIGNPLKLNPESIFYEKSIVFTGTLSSMTRGKAQQMIADIGGINSNTVTKDTDFLIVGQQDFRFVGEDGLSGKQEKAQKLLEKGATIEVISESDFLRNI